MTHQLALRGALLSRRPAIVTACGPAHGEKEKAGAPGRRAPGSAERLTSVLANPRHRGRNTGAVRSGEHPPSEAGGLSKQTAERSETQHQSQIIDRIEIGRRSSVLTVVHEKSRMILLFGDGRTRRLERTS